MSVYEAVKLPTCPHTKLDTTADNPKDAAYPAQTLNYVELMGFLTFSASAAMYQSAG
jgi:hypothetical protein